MLQCLDESVERRYAGWVRVWGLRRVRSSRGVLHVRAALRSRSSGRRPLPGRPPLKGATVRQRLGVRVYANCSMTEHPGLAMMVAACANARRVHA
jgi:hypothetical protein